jgi:hypothetical protein
MNKLLKWIKKNKMASLAIGLFILLILLLSYFGIGSDNEQQPTPPPAVVDNTPFFLKTITPTPPTFTSIRSTEPIIFQFNKPININSVKVAIKPDVEYQIIYKSTDPTKFGVVANEGWDVDKEYTIIVSKTLSSITGTPLSEDITTSFTRKSVKSGDLKLPGDEDL